MSTQFGSNVIALLALLINIVALCFVAIQVLLLRRQMRDASEMQAREILRVKRQSSLEYMARTLRRRQELAAELPNEADASAVNQFLKQASADPAKLRSLWDYLNFWEQYATAVNMDILDAEVTSRTSGRTITNVAEAYQNFIKMKRVEEKSPFLYIELEQLAKTMRMFRAAQLDKLAADVSEIGA